MPNFYSVIIGSELLNGRRQDSHFEFFNRELLKRGWVQKANFVIKDDPQFMEDVFNLIKADKNSVMFCFGGIGSTPDDYTREVAGKVFSDGMSYHDEAKKIILEKMGDRAYPHRIKMAYLPNSSKLLPNPINKMPGFFLEDRYFFTPGFPNMAHPMVSWAMDKFFKKAPESFECSFVAISSEAEMIDIMNDLPNTIELSCLPQLQDGKKTAEIRLSTNDKKELEKWCAFFKKELDKIQIKFKEI